MKKSVLLSLLVSLICLALSGLFSCSKNERKETQPIPAAIQAKITAYTNCTCSPYAVEYSWKGKTVYLFSCAGPACNCVTLYYDENGESIDMPEGYSPEDFNRESTLIGEIWRCNP